ncbi:type IV secretory system conjugative DNA transfer family protein [Demequina litorisediminis]|uniref:TraM recognition site of TraD and TraG n=1 Tax=Demequina litorisediminis TaxID=1849022 RepID=A0ABQ6IJB1_9MICO|nr:type IV secretory system conjugative DNA transfer family protein [Demequina litorisediminis]GMA37819.1 hypothetical protein GCM10025876_40230 [Demequina litorisediminis]
MSDRRPLDPQFASLLTLGGVALTCGTGLYAGLHWGTAAASIDQDVPGHPLDAVDALVDGTIQWPGAWGWAIAAGIWAAGAAVTVALGMHSRRATTHKGLASARKVTKATSPNDTHRQVIGFEGNKPVSIRSEDAGLMIAPPRSGKTTTRVIGAVIDAPGAVVTTSTKAEVLRLTHLSRSHKGSVHVFDPEGMSGWPTPASWDIVAGCQDPNEADERARAMVKAAPMGEGATNAAFFEQAASAVLGAYLHAAALDGRTIADVVAWAHDTRMRDPYSILESHHDAAPGWASELETYTRGQAGPTIQSVQMTLGNALSALRTGKTVEAVLPSPRMFDVDAFLDSSDTLYLMSTMGEGSAAPLTTALVATIERHARIRSQQSTTGRFETPVTLVLDEAPNIAPIPSLPALMTDSGGRGMIVWTITQSFAQARGALGCQRRAHHVQRCRRRRAARRSEGERPSQATLGPCRQAPGRTHHVFHRRHVSRITVIQHRVGRQPPRRPNPRTAHRQGAAVLPQPATGPHHHTTLLGAARRQRDSSLPRGLRKQGAGMDDELMAIADNLAAESAPVESDSPPVPRRLDWDKLPPRCAQSS